MTHPTLTMPDREALEAARKHYAVFGRGQIEATALAAIDACLSAWPAENAVEAGARAAGECPWEELNDWAKNYLRRFSLRALLAANLHTSARIAELEAENARLREALVWSNSQPEGHEPISAWIKRQPSHFGVTLIDARTALEPRT